MTAPMTRGDALKAVEEMEICCHLCTEWKCDREVVLAAVKSSVDALLGGAREDKEVLLAACAANGRALRYRG